MPAHPSPSPLALEEIWQRPVTPEQLQGEMDRMARETKNVGLVRELWRLSTMTPF